MTSEQPKVPDDSHVVIKFRPRTAANAQKPPAEREAATSFSQPPDLSRFERTAEPDDYRYRMRVNIAAGLFTVVLIGFGIWLATSIADLRRTQDCLLMGRRDCGAPISAPGK